MANKIALYPAQVSYAVSVVEHNVTRYAVREVTRARSTGTPKRYQQRALAAGRQAIAEALFEGYPVLGGDYHKLTKAIRAGHDGDTTDFDSINRRGAVALGLISEEN